MNIIDAIKTGRKIRLVGADFKELTKWFDPAKAKFLLEFHEAISNEWEVEDQAVEFTESELASLLKSYVGDARFNGMLYSEALNAIVADIFERKIKGSITK